MNLRLLHIHVYRFSRSLRGSCVLVYEEGMLLSRAQALLSKVFVTFGSGAPVPSGSTKSWQQQDSPSQLSLHD